jgi:UDP-2,4-diacetamido-2,4,6-trideoxy-beta-L-altropyranose hydrolase
MRCLTLAGALRERESDVSFVCREHEGNLCKLIGERGFRVDPLPLRNSAVPAEAVPAHSRWLGDTWQADAELTLAAIRASNVMPDWLVVDHYALDERWERRLRPATKRIMVIDDLADRPHDCDLLLDQNLVARGRGRYAGNVPEKCAMLLSPEYALLQSGYAELHERIDARNGPVRRIFIFFGGTDVHNLTGRSLAGLLRLDRPDIEVDVVVPACGPHAAAIHSLASGHDNLHLHGNLPTLAPLMASADLAIGAGGGTTWERLCLGLPSLVVAVAENQRATAEELSRLGLIRFLGGHDQVTESSIAQALQEALQETSNEQWSRRCLAVVDGKGVARVGAVMTATVASPLRARHVVAGDEALLLEWANDPITRKNAFSPERITAETHHAWFHARLRDVDDCRFYIVENDDSVPIGTVRFERSGPIWEVHFSLAPSFRGRELGRRLLEVAMLNLRADNMGTAQVLGQVKEGNLPSRRIFEALAFETLPETKAGVIIYRRTL